MIFKVLFVIVIAIIGISDSFPHSDDNSQSELKAAGMSAAGLSGFKTLSQKFEKEFPTLAEKDQEQFLTTFKKETEDYVKTLSPEDQKIYAGYKKRVEERDD